MCVCAQLPRLSNKALAVRTARTLRPLLPFVCPTFLPLRQVPRCPDRFFSQGLGQESFESGLLAIDFVAGSLFGTMLWCAWKVTTRRLLELWIMSEVDIIVSSKCNFYKLAQRRHHARIGVMIVGKLASVYGYGKVCA